MKMMTTTKRFCFACLAVFSILLLANGLLIAAVKEETGKFTFPEYSKMVLENGLTVYLMEQHDVPLIYVSAVFQAGAINDALTYGLADMTAESLMFGAGKLSKGEIDEMVDFYGASVGTGGGLENAFLAATFAAADQDKFFPLIRDIITAPRFEAEEVAKYKDRLKVELMQAKESPGRVIGAYFNRFIFGNNPYGNPVSGTVTTIEKITVDDVKKFHDAFYRPTTSAIAVVGDFKADAMKALLKNLFGEWKGIGTSPGPVALEKNDFKPFEKSRVLLLNKSDSRQTTFLIGGWGIPFNNPDYVPIQLVNTIFGGRFTSWLNSELRIKTGLTYGARSGFDTMHRAGTFVISSFTATPTTERALDLAVEVVKRLHNEGIDQVTLDSGRNYMKGNFPRRYESPASLANFLTAMYVYDIDESFINDFAGKLDAVTIERSKEIIDKYFPKDNLQFVLAGKGDAIRDIVKKYGEVTELDINEDEFLSK